MSGRGERNDRLVATRANGQPAFGHYLGDTHTSVLRGVGVIVLTVEGAIASLDDRYEQVAATLGSRPLATFRRVTLPLVMPGLAAGAALAWARALGEFGATITFAGNLPGKTQTLPLDVYTTLDRNPDEAVALSLVLLAL